MVTNMPYLIPIISLVIAGHISFSNLIVHWEDFFTYVWWADYYVTLHDYPHWINGVFPVGYPLLLKTLFFISNDYLIAARIISLAGGVICLLFTYRIVLALFKDRRLAFLSQLFLFFSLFLQWFFLEGNDTLALSLQLISVYYIMKEQQKDSDFIMAGVFAGLAYMVRYQSLVLVVITFFWLLYTHKGKESSSLKNANIYLIFFLIASFPHLYTSWSATGNPFWMSQGKNIWFGIYGDQNWVSNWQRVPYDISIFSVIMLSPAKFLLNWFRQFRHGLELIQPMFPLNFFAIAGLLLSLFKEEHGSRKNIVYTVIVISGILVVTSVAFVLDRFLIFAYPFMIIFVLRFIDRIIPEKCNLGRHFQIPMKLLFFIAALSYMAFITWLQYVPSYVHNPYFQANAAVTKVLNENGMMKESEVFSSSTYFYNSLSPKKRRFSTLVNYGTPENFSSIETLKNSIKSTGIKFVIFEERDGYPNYPGLRDLYDPSKAPPSFHLIYRQETYPRMVIYKIS